MADDAGPMFEIGAKYRIVTGLGEHEGYSSFTIIAYEAPLLKAQAFSEVIVFNTSSPSFVRAEKELTEEEKLASMADLPDYLKPPAPPSR